MNYKKYQILCDLVYGTSLDVMFDDEYFEKYYKFDETIKKFIRSLISKIEHNIIIELDKQIKSVEWNVE